MGTITILAHCLTSACKIACKGSMRGSIFLDVIHGFCHVMAHDAPAAYAIYEASTPSDGEMTGLYSIEPQDIDSARLKKTDRLVFDGKTLSVHDSRNRATGCTIAFSECEDKRAMISKMRRFIEHNSPSDSISNPFFQLPANVISDLHSFLCVSNKSVVCIEHVSKRDNSYEIVFFSEHDGDLIRYVCILKEDTCTRY